MPNTLELLVNLEPFLILANENKMCTFITMIRMLIINKKEASNDKK